MVSGAVLHGRGSLRNLDMGPDVLNFAWFGTKLTTVPTKMAVKKTDGLGAMAKTSTSPDIQNPTARTTRPPEPETAAAKPGAFHLKPPTKTSMDCQHHVHKAIFIESIYGVVGGLQKTTSHKNIKLPQAIKPQGLQISCPQSHSIEDGMGDNTCVIAVTPHLNNLFHSMKQPINAAPIEKKHARSPENQVLRL